MSAERCPACGASQSRFMSIVALATQFLEDGEKTPTRNTLRHRGIRIAESLGLTVIHVDGKLFVPIAEVDAVAGIGAAA